MIQFDDSWYLAHLLDGFFGKGSPGLVHSAYWFAFGVWGVLSLCLCENLGWRMDVLICIIPLPLLTLLPKFLSLMSATYRVLVMVLTCGSYRLVDE